jgi:hypothetical protein
MSETTSTPNPQLETQSEPAEIETSTIEPTNPVLDGGDPQGKVVSPGYGEVPIAPSQPSGASSRETLLIPTSTMAKIKQKEREKGRAQAEKEFSERLAIVARVMGFNSWEDMSKASPEAFWEAKLGRSRSDDGSREGALEDPESETDMIEDQSEQEDRMKHPRITKRHEEERQRLLDKQKQLNRAVARAERKAITAEKALANQETENELRLEAFKAGVQDVDYALVLLRRHLKGKPKEEIEAFKPEKYFQTTLRESSPHLYVVQVEPATTGVSEESTGASTPAPVSGQSRSDGEESGPVDARKLTPDDFQKLLAKHGLRDPSVGMPG